MGRLAVMTARVAEVRIQIHASGRRAPALPTEVKVLLCPCPAPEESFTCLVHTQPSEPLSKWALLSHRMGLLRILPILLRREYGLYGRNAEVILCFLPECGQELLPEPYKRVEFEIFTCLRNVLMF